MAVLMTSGGATPTIHYSPITLTLQDLGDYGYVKINGTTYAPGTYELEVGTEIDVYITGSYDDSTYVLLKVFGEQTNRAIEAVYTYDTSMYPKVSITISLGYESIYGEYCVYIEETV